MYTDQIGAHRYVLAANAFDLSFLDCAHTTSRCDFGILRLVFPRDDQSALVIIVEIGIEFSEHGAATLCVDFFMESAPHAENRQVVDDRGIADRMRDMIESCGHPVERAMRFQM